MNLNFARTFAIAAHSAVGQVRKYTGEPYWTHPCAVAKLVMQVSDISEVAIAAAYLHDVVEDTKVTIEVIDQQFGPYVAQLVAEVTDVSKPEDGNRAVRKAVDREHLAKASPEAQSIKLADIIDNTKSIVAHDPKFAEVYLAEKRLLMPFLLKGDAGLFDRAMDLIDG